MRRIILLSAMTIICVSLAGCGTSSGTTSKTEAALTTEAFSTTTGTTTMPTPTPTPTSTPTPTPEIKTIAPGQVITTENKEITINKIEFADEVLPDDTFGYYNYYQSEEGQVFLHLDVDVKNLQKENLVCDSIMSVTVDYNDGYTYTADAVVEDKTLGFTYASITSIAPLASQGVHFLASCPDEVETSTDKALQIIIKVDGEEYLYKMR